MIPRIIRAVPRRLLWLDVLYPVALVVILSVGITKLIYTGALDATLAAKADFELLERALRISSPLRKATSGKISLISITDAEVLGRPHASRDGLVDLSLADYAQLIDKVAAQKPELIVVRLLPALHDNTPEAYAPLVQTLRRLNDRERIFLAYPQTGQFGLHSELKNVATLLDDDVCMRRVMLCPYVKEWNDWVVQVLLNRISELRGVEPPKAAMTKFFPIRFPTFIVDGVPPELIPSESAMHLLDQDPQASSLAGKIVMIGRDITTAAEDLGIKTAYSAFDQPIGDANWGHTPLHVFWAGIADMHFGNRFISVATLPLVVTCTIVSCLIVIGAFLCLGVGMGGILTITWLITIILANIASLTLLHVYVPLFSVIYFSFITFMFMGFGRLSYEAFTRWLATERGSRYSHTADLRGNFISLLSHNLNTPVAKMQGMLGILIGSSKNTAILPLLMETQHFVARLEVIIRTILVTTAIDEGSTTAAPITARMLMDEFYATSGSTLKRAGIPYSIEVVAEGEDLEVRPIAVDKKVFAAAGSAMIWLAVDQRGFPEVKLRWTLSETADGGVKIVMDVPVQSKQALVIAAFSDSKKHADGDFKFFDEIMMRLATLASESFQGGLNLSSEPTPRLQLTMEFT